MAKLMLPRTLNFVDDKVIKSTISKNQTYVKVIGHQVDPVNVLVNALNIIGVVDGPFAS